MQTIETGRLPIMLWSDEKLEGEVRTQAVNYHVLKKRIVELESKCDPVAVFVAAGAGP